jgi:hypothetical protein
MFVVHSATNHLHREGDLMSGNGTLNAFAASTFGHDFVVIHSELGRYIYKEVRK